MGHGSDDTRESMLYASVFMCVYSCSIPCLWLEPGKSLMQALRLVGEGGKPAIACVLRGEHQPTPATVRDEGAVLQEAGLRDP